MHPSLQCHCDVRAGHWGEHIDPIWVQPTASAASLPASASVLAQFPLCNSNILHPSTANGFSSSDVLRRCVGLLL